MDALSIAQVEAVAVSHPQLSELLQTILSIFGERITFLQSPAGGNRSSTRLIADFATLSFQRAEVAIQLESPTVQAGLGAALLKLNLAARGKPIVRTFTASSEVQDFKKYLEPLAHQLLNVIDHALIQEGHLKLGFTPDTLLQPASSRLEYNKEATNFTTLPPTAVRILARPWWATEYLKAWSSTLFGQSTEVNLSELVQAAAQNLADFHFIASELRRWFYHGDFRSPFTYSQAVNDLFVIAQLPRIQEVCQLILCPSRPPTLV